MPTFTGQLGTLNSMLENIELGAVGGASPPPPPPPGTSDPQVHLPAVTAITRFGPPSGLRPVYTFPLDVVHPAGSIPQQQSNRQVYMPAFPRAAPVPGPWNGFVPQVGRYALDSVAAAATPPSQIYMPPFPRSAPVKGPWNGFAPAVITPSLGPSGSPPPPPPGPPPPPPPGTAIGPLRNQVKIIPRAPHESNDRTRPHIDAVADVLNSLFRLGYLQQLTNGNYSLLGGAIANARPPQVTDDASVGAFVGMHYVNTLDSSVWICVNAAVGAAVWKKVATS